MSDSSKTQGAIVWQAARYPSMGATAAEKAFLGPDEMYEVVVLRMPACGNYPTYCRWEVWGPPLHGKLLAAADAATPETAKLMAEAYVLRLLATVQLSAGQGDTHASGKVA